MTDQYDDAAADEPSQDEPSQDEPSQDEPSKDEPSKDEPGDATRRETDWERKRRLAEIFGDALPETTRDERGPGPRTSSGESAGDQWLRSQVPPHHGG